MNTNITLLNWRKSQNESELSLSIADDVILLEKQMLSPPINTPFKIDVTVAVIGIKGESKGTNNLRSYVTKANTLMIILPGQILTRESTSEDFEARYIVMSNKFLASLGMHEDFPAFTSVANNPFFILTDSEHRSVLAYYEMLRAAVANQDNKYRLETSKHLTLAFFYGASNMFGSRQVQDDSMKSRHDRLVEEFLSKVRDCYKQERGMQYYADLLCLTPKYLSALVKKSTGISGNEWIDRYVALEAKALLKSTTMTVQQISDELSFPSQSFFGKYFKRVVGISPSEYRGG